MTLLKTALLAALLTSSSGDLSQREEEAVQAAALKHYLAQQKPPQGDPVCLAVSGYKAPSASLRRLLRGVKLDRDKNCHLRVGALVYSLTRAGLDSDDSGDLARLELSRLTFGDVSMIIERFIYKLELTSPWRVRSAERAAQ